MQVLLSRRQALIGAAGLLCLPTGCARQAAQIYRDPGCGCCLEWVKRLNNVLDVAVEVFETADRSAIALAHGLPKQLSSCHSAVIDGLLFEGHVPVDDLRQLLDERPSGIGGLAVPGMPIGSPGMELGEEREAFDVFAFGVAGIKIYAHHA